jgi:hypothetical protein
LPAAIESLPPLHRELVGYTLDDVAWPAPPISNCDRHRDKRCALEYNMREREQRQMRFLVVFLALFIGAAVAQLPDDEWLPRPIAHWPQEPDGFNGLKFGSTQAAVEKQTALRDAQIDSRNGGASYRTRVKVWGIDLDVSVLFLADHLSLISVVYPANDFADVKAKLIELLGPVHKAHSHDVLDGRTKGEDLFWYSSRVFIRLTEDDWTHSHGFFLATYEYMKDNGGAVMRPVDPPAWVPFPADHWPQEPDGFNGMRFDATRAETEKAIKLESCETVKYGNLSCKTTLVIAGKAFGGDVLFAVPHDMKTGSPIGEGHLANIYAGFGKADFAFVKAAFINMYGQPHQTDTQDGECLLWTGNKAEIRLNESRGDAAFVISPNMRARGATSVATVEDLPEVRPPIPTIPIEKLPKTLRIKTSRGIWEVERGDLMDIGTLSYKFIQKGNDYQYLYTFDNNKVWFVGLGGLGPGDSRKTPEAHIAQVQEVEKNSTQPRDWWPFGFGWGQSLLEHATPEFSKTAQYSLVSKLRPGVISMFFQSDIHHYRQGVSQTVVAPPAEAELTNSVQPLLDEPQNPMIWLAEEQALNTAESWRYNSLRKYVIGPAIEPGATQGEILALVKRWTEDYKFFFLRPLLIEGGDPKSVLNSLKPKEGLERDILECLRAVL